MTRQSVKDAAQQVVVPTTVALALIALAVRVWAMPAPSSIDISSQLGAALVERDRQYREDRNEVMRLLMDLRGDIRRIEGKLEK